MNKKLCGILLCFVALNVVAHTADIQVIYTALSPSLKDGKTIVENQFILLSNTTESPEWHWTVGETTKDILGYECVEATTDFIQTDYH